MTKPLDVAIIGAGPAGISAAANAAHHNLSYALYEKGHLANTIYEYQKGKHVMAHPVKLPLRSHVAFAEGTRESILATFETCISEGKLNVVNSEIRSITLLEDGLFELQHGEERTLARHVILSMGVQGSPRKLGVPGEQQSHIAYSLRDPAEFTGKNIIVVGAGDAAIENAIALAEHNTVTILNRSPEFARAKDGNVKLITEAISEERIVCFSSAKVSQIDEKTAVVDTPDGDVEVLCDHMIVRAGAIPPSKFLAACGIDLPEERGALPSVDGRYMSNVENLFLVGALIGYPLIKQCINQGYEAIEHILGHDVEPADWVLIEERLSKLPGTVESNYELIRKNVPLFADLSEPQFREFLIESPVYAMQPGDIVFERLDYTDSFWSIVTGSVDIHIGETKRINLTTGNFFGEMGLMSGRRRSATVTAHEVCLLVETPRKQILKLISSVESIKRQLDEMFILRMLPTIFPKADRSFFKGMVKTAQLKRFKKGEVLFSEGDIGDELHLIRRGSVKISRKDPSGVDITRTYIPAGNYLGEIALLSEEPAPRTASVTAVVSCETIVIDKVSFHSLLDSNEEVREQVRHMAEQRRFNDVTTGHSKKEGAVLDFMFKEGVTDASSLLVINSDMCVACNNCETACAATHDGQSRLDRQGGKFFDAIQLPISCRHCENPLCMLDCPPDALTRKPDGEVIIGDSCIGCGNCVSNCPYGVPRLVYKQGPFNFWEWIGIRKPEKGPARAAKCDLCSNLAAGPACVRACPTGAAARINPQQLAAMVGSKGTA